MVDNIRLKVLINKNTKQGMVFLPKKKFDGSLPKFINISIVKKFKKGGVL